jgi:hypothetical protein
MKLDWKILAIGIAIGIAAAFSIAFASLQGTGQDNNHFISINCKMAECIDFYLFGFVKEISADSLSLVQSLNHTDSGTDPVITMRIDGMNAPLLWCSENPAKCNITTYDKIPTGSYVCAHARLNPDGSFAVSRFFFNQVCTSNNPPDSDNDGLSDGCEINLTKTDWLNADSDMDGVSDADEDPDGDGLTNRKECDSGTNPSAS